MQVTVKDLKEYLSTMPEDTPVHLDKDGWLENELHPRDVQHLIRMRGVFQKYDESKFGGSLTLFINN